MNVCKYVDICISMHLYNVVVFQVDFMIDKSNCLSLNVESYLRKIYWNVGSLYPWSF